MKGTMGRMAAVLLCSVGVMAAGAQTPSCVPPPAAQQQGPPPGGMGGRGMRMDPARRLEMLQRQLNLTPDQTAQVKALFETERSKMEALRSSGDAGQDRRAAMMAIRQDEETKMLAILTPEQQTRYKEMQARMRERMMERRDGGSAPPPPPPTTPQQ